MNRPPTLLVVGFIAGCTSFPDPDIVVDLRVLSLTASVPEQVVDVDLEDPEQPAALLAQLVPSEICVLVVDPAFDRRLRYQLTLCVNGGGARCDTSVMAPIGAGVIDDPDTAVPAPRICATVTPNGNLLGVLLETLRYDTLRGLGGLDYLVQLRIGGELAAPELDLFGAKTLRVAPRIPAARTANVNPTLDRIEASIERGEPSPLAMGRCVDQASPLEVPPGATVRLTPIEPDGAREAYVVPTIDGKFQMFTESLTYQWIASAGSFASGSTGGPRGPTGNPAPLFTDWRAPRASDLDGPTDIQLWIIQRDERLGVQAYETCLRVVP